MDNNESRLSSATQDLYRSILVVLPDYAGFESPSERRASDDLMRAYLVRLLNELHTHLASLLAYQQSRGQSALYAQTLRIDQRLEVLSDKIQSVPYAYSLFFTANRVSGDSQESIVADDYALLGYSGQIENILQPTLTEESDFEGILSRVNETILALDERFEQRINHIMNFH